MQFIWPAYRPHLSLDHTLDTSYPTPPTGTHDPHGLVVESWSYYLSEIAAHKIRGRFCSTLYKRSMPMHFSVEEVMKQRRELDIQVDSWYESLPKMLQYPKDPRLEINENIETRPHLRHYCFVMYYQFSMIVLHHGLHAELDKSFDECLRMATIDLRRFLVLSALRENHRLHFGSYYMCRFVIDCAVTIMLCLHSQRFVGLIETEAEQEALSAVDNYSSMFNKTRGLKKGMEVFNRIHDELWSSRRRE